MFALISRVFATVGYVTENANGSSITSGRRPNVSTCSFSWRDTDGPCETCEQDHYPGRIFWVGHPFLGKLHRCGQPPEAGIHQNTGIANKGVHAYQPCEVCGGTNKVVSNETQDYAPCPACSSVREEAQRVLLYRSTNCTHEGPCPGSGDGSNVYPHSRATGEVL